MKGLVEPVPIFNSKSVTPESTPFYLYPNYVMAFYAYGFASESIQLSESGIFGTQAACLNSILWKDNPLPVPNPNAPPTPVLDLQKYVGQILAEQEIITNGCPWQLSACNNIALLDLSGSYRLVLNDSAAVTIAHVYYRVFPKEEMLPRNSRLYLGE